MEQSLASDQKTQHFKDVHFPSSPQLGQYNLSQIPARLFWRQQTESETHKARQRATVATRTLRGSKRRSGDVVGPAWGSLHGCGGDGRGSAVGGPRRGCTPTAAARDLRTGAKACSAEKAGLPILAVGMLKRSHAKKPKKWTRILPKIQTIIPNE